MVSRTIQLGLASVILAAAGAVSTQQTTYDYMGTPMSGTVFGTLVGPGGEFGSYQCCCTTLDGGMTLSSPLVPGHVIELSVASGACAHWIARAAPG